MQLLGRPFFNCRKNTTMLHFRLCLTTALLIYGSFSIAQTNAKPRQELGISFFAWEKNFVTLHNPLAFKLVPGVQYIRFSEKWHWASTLLYGNNLIEDNCTGCFDHFYGLGRLKEWNISSGFRRNFLEQQRFQVQPWVETAAYFEHFRYQGDFQGGFTGGGTRLNRAYWSIGLTGRFGLLYSPNGLLTISAYSTFKIGIGGLYETIFGDRYRSKTTGFSLVKFAIGYRF
jgi:hypothetical protein